MCSIIKEAAKLHFFLPRKNKQNLSTKVCYYFHFLSNCLFVIIFSFLSFPITLTHSHKHTQTLSLSLSLFLFFSFSFSPPNKKHSELLLTEASSCSCISVHNGLGQERQERSSITPWHAAS